jgi:hypothetical protein
MTFDSDFTLWIKFIKKHNHLTEQFHTIEHAKIPKIENNYKEYFEDNQYGMDNYKIIYKKYNQQIYNIIDIIECIE